MVGPSFYYFKLEGKAWWNKTITQTETNEDMVDKRMKKKIEFHMKPKNQQEMID